MEGKYKGLRSGSYAERAVDIVREAESIDGPALAIRLGIGPSMMSSALRKAIALGYLSKSLTGQAEGMNKQVNIYVAGDGVEHDGGKRLVQQLLEHVAADGSATSVALAEAFDIDPKRVSACLADAVRRDLVKKRLVKPTGGQHRMIIEYFDADVARYLNPNAPPAPLPGLVPSRTPFAFRPLNLARLGTMPQREGAWDFRNIPSRHTEDAR